jgi:hypothetical protein
VVPVSAKESRPEMTSDSASFYFNELFVPGRVINFFTESVIPNRNAKRRSALCDQFVSYFGRMFSIFREFEAIIGLWPPISLDIGLRQWIQLNKVTVKYKS